MTPDQVRSLDFGSRFTIRNKAWKKGRIMAWFGNGDPMDYAFSVLLDEHVSVSLKRSDFLRDEFVLDQPSAN
jgi:hypothetical protein